MHLSTHSFFFDALPQHPAWSQQVSLCITEVCLFHEHLHCTTATHCIGSKNVMVGPEGGGGHGSGSLHKEDKGTSARGTSRGHLGEVSVILYLRDGVIIKRHRQPKGISRWPQDMFIPKRDKRRSRKRSQRENTHFRSLLFPICSYFTPCFQTSWPRFPVPEAGRHQLPLETVYKVLWQLPVSRAIGHGFRSLWVQLPWNPAFLASS